MRIAIIEDMTSESLNLVKILNNIAEKHYMTFNITCFESGEKFLEIFEKGSFDIIFMDIYLNGIDGVETSRRLRKSDRQCMLIFLTGSMEHMPDAFSCHAFEYIQKPLSAERVGQVMTDAINILTAEQPYIEFTDNRQTIRLMYSDFAAAVSSEHYINITDVDGNTYKTRQTFSEFIQSLNNDSRFLNINKGIIVNMDYVLSIEDNTCTLQNGEPFPVKVRDSIKIKKKWHKYLFEQIHTVQKRKKRH